MQWLPTYLLLIVAVHGGGGVTKDTGIEQFWTDDYKIFEHVYGKTSDKHIYGDLLPAPIIYTRDKTAVPSDKKERYFINYNDPNTDQFDTQTYDNLLSKQPLKIWQKAPSSSINFINYSNFKPISQTRDPLAYNYLKHLEDYSKGEKYDTHKNINSLNPYLNKQVTSLQESDAYRSIQELLESHEANKGGFKVDENIGYLTYPKNKSKKPERIIHDLNKRRCVDFRCRQKSSYFRGRRSHKRTPSFKTVVVM